MDAVPAASISFFVHQQFLPIITLGRRGDATIETDTYESAATLFVAFMGGARINLHQEGHDDVGAPSSEPLEDATSRSTSAM